MYIHRRGPMNASQDRAHRWAFGPSELGPMDLLTAYPWTRPWVGCSTL